MSTRVAVNPDLLHWALARAGLSDTALAKKFPKLGAWLCGELQPTLKQLEAFATATHTAIGLLFLPEPPENWPVPDELTDAGSVVVVVDDEGGVVVPMSLWASLGIAAGDRVELWLDGDTLRVSPVSDGLTDSADKTAVERRG